MFPDLKCNGDYVTYLIKFLKGYETPIEMYHCPYHPEHDLSLKMEDNRFYCFVCGRDGTYAQLKIYCKSYMNRPTDDFAAKNYRPEWYRGHSIRLNSKPFRRKNEIP